LIRAALKAQSGGMPFGIVRYMLGRILAERKKLSDVAVREGKQIKEFGYIDTTEPKPLID